MAFAAALGFVPSLSDAHPAVRPASIPSFAMTAIGPALTAGAYLPNGLNDGAAVVGTRLMSPAPPVAFFSAKGKLYSAGIPKGIGIVGSEALGIDDAGTLAANGCLNTPCNSTRAYAGQIPKGAVTWKALPPPKVPTLCTHAGCNSAVGGIGPTGDVAGQFGPRATLWVRNSHGGYGAARLLLFTKLKGWDFNSSQGQAADSFGDVVGIEQGHTAVPSIGGRLTEGVLWPRHGKPHILPGCQTVLSLGAPPKIDAPFAVTANGSSASQTLTIAGQCLVRSQSTKQTGYVPCIWHVTIHGSAVSVPAGVQIDASDGSSSGAGVAINKKGWIVGYQGDPNATVTLWVKGNLYPLDGLIPINHGWSLVGVYALNDEGQITAIATQNSRVQSFLLTPR